VTVRWSLSHDATIPAPSGTGHVETGEDDRAEHGREVDSGQAGATLGREYERRRANRERRAQDAHPHIGGLLLALNGEPQHQQAFRAGEQGERAVGAMIEDAVENVGGFVLHNRRMPSGGGDIDHVAIVPSGVYVVDTKAVTGKVEIRRPWLKPDQLFIAGRDRTTYLDGLDRQTQVVRGAIDRMGCRRLTVQGALCFTHADLPLLPTQEIRGHLLLYRKALTKKLTADGPVDGDALAALAWVLAASFRAA
jgi:hypothetical protein